MRERENREKARKREIEMLERIERKRERERDYMICSQMIILITFSLPSPPSSFSTF